MDIIETRRENLRRWVAENGVPQKEKSLFSQLKTTASFGEKLARRLEKQYRMGERYLDTPSGAVARLPVVETPAPRAARMILAFDDEERLLDLYRRADERGRVAILKLATREAGAVADASVNEA